jgi:hypothetical protein
VLREFYTSISSQTNTEWTKELGRNSAKNVYQHPCLQHFSYPIYFCSSCFEGRRLSQHLSCHLNVLLSRFGGRLIRIVMLYLLVVSGLFNTFGARVNTSTASFWRDFRRVSRIRNFLPNQKTQFLSVGRILGVCIPAKAGRFLLEMMPSFGG